MHTTTCPVCHGNARSLGSLGDATHYRCEDCGHQFHESDDVDSEHDIEAWDIAGLDTSEPLHLEA